MTIPTPALSALTLAALDRRGLIRGALIGSGMLGAGLLVGAMTASMMVVSPVGGHLSDRFGRRAPVVAGSALAVCATAGLAAIAADPGTAATAALVALAGLGVGLVPASVSVIQLPGVRFIVPQNTLKESELWLVYRRFEHSPAVKKLLSVLMKR